MSVCRLLRGRQESGFMNETVKRGGGRGFASMSSERQREIARKGGKAAHARGKAHEFTREEAQAAGRKGGERVSENRTHMAAIGRVGGQRSRRKSPEAAGRPGEDAGASEKTAPD
jgi:general stress protein YciG